MRRRIKELSAWLLTVALVGGMTLSNPITAFSYSSSEDIVSNVASPADATKETDENENGSKNDMTNPADDDREVRELNAATPSNALYYHEFLTSDGITVVIESEGSIWPGDTTIKVEKVDAQKNDKIKSLVEETVDDGASVSEVYAYDISFWSKGEEFEPEGNIKVTFRFPDALGTVSDTDTEIFHVKDNENSIDIMRKSSQNDTEVSCYADGFSIYGVALLSINASADFQIEGTTLVKYLGKSKVVRIPDGIETIGEEAFEYNDSIEEVIIPDSVRTIMRHAFAHAPNLKKLVIGSGLRSANGLMITGSSNLETIEVDPHNRVFYVEDGVLRQTGSSQIDFYPGGKKDKRYVIPAGVTYIDFHGNQYVEEIVISSDVEQLDLTQTKSLRKIEVVPENKNFKAVDGVLYNYDMTHIIHYPSGKPGDTFIVPNTVKELGDLDKRRYYSVFEDGELENICFTGKCPINTTYPDPWHDWSSAFQADKTFHLFYYNDPTWESLVDAFDRGLEYLPYIRDEIDLNPVVKGYSIVSNNEEIVIQNPVQFRVVENDLENGVINKEIKPEYWKATDDRNTISEEGVFIGKVLGKATIQAGVGNPRKIVEAEITVVESPDKHSDVIQKQEWDVLRLTNKERMSEGLDPLSTFGTLQKAIDIRKQELAILYSHTRPNGEDCITALDELGIYGSPEGENIAAGYRSAKEVVNGWMESPGHRANILTPDFTHMGAGYINDGETIKPSWVQMFLGNRIEEFEKLFIDQGKKYQVTKGSLVDDADVTVVCYSSVYGVTYIPLIEEMCTGYDKDTIGIQTVNVTYKGLEATVEIEVVKGSSSSSGSSGGSGGGGGGGGGSSSRGSSSAVVMPGNPGTGTLPSYVVKGTWNGANGQWNFVDENGQQYRSKWAAIYNPYANTAAGQSNFDWFYFDSLGQMVTGWYRDADGSYYYLNPASDGTRGRMVTGWAWIPDASGTQYCYYFNPNSDGYRGKMLINTIVDGYTLDQNGRWTVNGAVQTK